MNTVVDILAAIWEYFATNILQQPAFMIGFIVLLGYILEKKKWYEVLSGFLKATVGYLILMAGSGGLVNTFRPILVGLKSRFHLSAMVTDPYFGKTQLRLGLCTVSDVHSVMQCYSCYLPISSIFYWFVSKSTRNCEPSSQRVMFKFSKRRRPFG